MFVYEKHGRPAQVVHRADADVARPTGSDVLVKMLAAPLNPSDLNMIEGVYPIVPEGEQKVGGNEGVGVVEQVGSSVANLKEGDWVIPRHSGFGTWRTHALAGERDFIKIANDIPKEFAATISVNPCTALRLVSDFGLKKGDTLIQNAATSVVGQCVIQIAALRGINSINVIRDRPNLATTKRHLTELGATHVVTEEEFREASKGWPKATVAFNAVGGRSATQILQYLRKNDGGTMITFGAMSRQPMRVPSGIFSPVPVTLRGFWMTAWHKERSDEERMAMFKELEDLIRAGKLKWAINPKPFAELHESLEALEDPKRSPPSDDGGQSALPGKTLFVFDSV